MFFSIAEPPILWKDSANYVGVYQKCYFNVAVEGVSKCDFAMSRDVTCRVSMFAIMYKIFNINGLFNQIVEGVSKL